MDDKVDAMRYAEEYANRPPERRLARVPISFQVLIDMCAVGWKPNGLLECIEGIPEGSVFIGSYSDDRTQCAYLIFSHPSFEIVPPGNSIPDVRVVHHIEPLFTLP